MPGWLPQTRDALEIWISRTVRILRLDYQGLKKRIEAADSGDLSQAAVRPKFVELPLSGTDFTAECTIECEDAKGARIRIHLKGPQLPDLAALGRALWSHGR